MQLLPTERRDVFVAHNPRRVYAVAGTFFAAFGAFVILGSFARTVLTTESISLPWYGIASLLAGVSIGMFQRGLSIDHPAGFVRSWWRMGPIGWSKNQELSSFREVQLKRLVARGATVYSVDLVGRGGSQQLARIARFNHALKFAKEVASAIGLPFTDHTGDAAAARAAGFGVSLRDQAKAAGEIPEFPLTLPTRRLDLTGQGPSMALEIGPSGLTFAHFVLATIVVAFAVFVALVVNVVLEGKIDLQADSWHPYLVAIGGLTAGFFALILRHAFSGSRLGLGVGWIEITEPRLFGTRHAAAATAAIEEVSIGDHERAHRQPWLGSKWIVVVTHDDVLAFGETLAPEERVYVRDLLIAFASRPSEPGNVVDERFEAAEPQPQESDVFP